MRRSASRSASSLDLSSSAWTWSSVVLGLQLLLLALDLLGLSLELLVLRLELLVLRLQLLGLRGDPLLSLLERARHGAEGDGQLPELVPGALSRDGRRDLRRRGVVAGAEPARQSDEVEDGPAHPAPEQQRDGEQERPGGREPRDHDAVRTLPQADDRGTGVAELPLLQVDEGVQDRKDRLPGLRDPELRLRQRSSARARELVRAPAVRGHQGGNPLEHRRAFRVLREPVERSERLVERPVRTLERRGPGGRGRERLRSRRDPEAQDGDLEVAGGVGAWGDDVLLPRQLPVDPGQAEERRCCDAGDERRGRTQADREPAAHGQVEAPHPRASRRLNRRARRSTTSRSRAISASGHSTSPSHRSPPGASASRSSRWTPIRAGGAR